MHEGDCHKEDCIKLCIEERREVYIANKELSVRNYVQRNARKGEEQREVVTANKELFISKCV
jgi:hypothetical protein